MERQPYYQPGETGGKENNKDKKTSGSFNVAPNSTFRPERSVQSPAERRIIPIAPAFEGVISWREKTDEMLRESEERQHPTEFQERVPAEPQDEQVNGKEKSYKKPQQPHLPVVPIPAPFAEVIAEQPGPQPVEAYAAADTEADGALDDFPPVEGRPIDYAAETVRPDVKEKPQPGAPFMPDAQSALYASVDVPLQGMAYDQQPAYAPNSLPVDPNVAPSDAVTAGGNIPPNQPGYGHGFNHDPFGPYGPAYSGAEAPSPAMIHQEAAPPMPLERPVVVPVANRDPRVGGVAALLGLEYFARKRADRKLEKRVNRRQDSLVKRQEKQMAANQLHMQEQQRQFAAEQARQGSEMHRMQYKETTPQSVTDALRSTANLPQPFESVPGMFAAPERPAAQTPPVERQAGMPVPQELRPQTQPTPEQANAETTEQQADMQIGAHQHVEHSAWHNIVVDERGHEVVGAIHYGEGFKRERQQEAIRDHMGDSGPSGAAPQSAGNGYAQDQSPMLPSGMTTPTLPQGHNTHIDPQHQLPANNQQQSNITNPWFWLMLILIIAAFFTAALI
ncbi:MAG TPA: hypothetical protein VFT16_02195 [Candidatus Saccharimonadales bacterium]|nr:hypothetical protein [Candidatus Saccharimonadales bacterium]